MAAVIFSLTYNVNDDYVALNYIAEGDDGCLHIMDTLLILLVARLNLASSYVKMHWRTCSPSAYDGTCMSDWCTTRFVIVRFFGTQHAHIFLQHSRSWAICGLHSEKFASQLVTLTRLSPLITTSAQDSHPLWTCLGIQISCMSSTVLTVLLLSTALHHSCSYGINILHTLPVRHTSRTKIFSHHAIWHLTTFPLAMHFPDWINMSTACLWCSLMATGWSTQFICAR